MVLREAECSGEVLYEQARAILEDGEGLNAMGHAAESMAVPDSAQRIMDIMMELIRK